MKYLKILIVLLLCGCSRGSDEVSGVLKITFFDTGNSDAMLIQSATSNVMIDAGDNDDEDYLSARLMDSGVERIDYLISTHPDADHCGGLDALVEHFMIGQVFVSNGSSEYASYQSFIHALSDAGLKPSVPLAKSVYSLDEDVTMRFFNTTALGEGNEVSLVTLITNGEQQYLFMGDAEYYTEQSIYSQLPQDITLLKVGHHGSSSSTSWEFIDWVRPLYSVILCGKDNDYGHPHQKVLNRLNEVQTQIYRSDLDGEISFIFEENETKIFTDSLIVNYIGNSSSHVYHDPTCSALPSSNNQVPFVNEETAIWLDYQAHYDCLGVH